MDELDFLTHGGSVAARMRAVDWASTPAGPVSGWPPLLRSTLATMLDSPQAMFLSWGEGMTSFYNDAYAPLLGLRDPGGLGRVFPDLWSEIWDDIEPIVRAAYDGTGSRFEDFPLTMTRHGFPEETWWTFSYTPLRDEAGTVRGMLCVTMEVSARMQAERHAAAERERLRALLDRAPNFMALLSGEDLRVTLANPAFERLHGGRPMLGLPYEEAVPEAAAEGVPALMRSVRATGEAHVEDGRPFGRDAPDGGRVLDFVLQPVLDAQGAVEAVFVAGQDVTEAHRAQAALRRVNASLERRVGERTAELRLLATIVETTDALIQVADTDLRWLAVNRAAADAFEGLFGLRPRVGDSMIDALAGHPEAQARVRALWGRALAGEEVTESAGFGEGAARRSFELRLSPLRDRAGRVTGAYQIGTDVTTRVAAEARLAEAEAQLRQAQKMEAIGQLTGGVAHDFNNLLTPIVGALDVMQRRRFGGPREERLLEGALQSAERARTLVSRLLAFARRQPLQVGPVDLAHLVEGLRNLVDSTVGPQVRVCVHVAHGLPAAVADANQLEMAILNLAVNARDAMPGGGSLCLSVARDDVGEGAVLPPGPYLRLRVEDTGTGMDEATRARAAEPFFSTKARGKGTGLGLSMVHGLALQLGGAMEIDSSPGQGTRVTLWLPAARRPATLPIEAGPEEPGTVAGLALLVDDEALVRDATADMLVELGYEVTAAGSGEEALRLVAEGLAPDLLVTDHLMPGMTGTDLALRLREARPGLPVLIVSGYAEASGLSPDLPRLPKPFRRDELARSLGRARRS